MATDEERRDAARYIRTAAGSGHYWPGVVGLAEIVGVEDTRWPGIEGRLLARLADLIEPTVDRGALLALADEMDHPIRQAVWNQTAGVRREHVMAEYARRIRAALGVTR